MALRLAEAGVIVAQTEHASQSTEEPDTMTDANAPWNGLRFVVTGKLQDMTRQQAEAPITNRGVTAASSVTAKTSYLVVGEKPGSKLARARSLGVTVLDEAEFRQAWPTPRGWSAGRPLPRRVRCITR